MPSGIPFVLKSDLDLVSFQKEPVALCSLLRKLAVEQGLADIEIEFHVSVPKTHPAAAAFGFKFMFLKAL